MSDQLLESLGKLGYDLVKRSNYYQTNAAYRNGDNKKSLVIYPESDLCIDFVTAEKFSIKTLYKRSLGLQTDEEIETWLKTENIVIAPKAFYPKIKMPEVYPIEILNELIPDHSYFINRGISEKILREFKGGVALKNKMKGRYVLPILTAKNEICGFTGRDILNYPQKPDSKFNRPKWSHLGTKTDWKWPLFLNWKLIKETKKVVLVESPADTLSFFECGFRNVICLFGVDLSFEIVNLLIRYDVKKIAISVNNDSLNGGEAGNIAAEKIERKLLRYFDRRQVKINLPTEAKDWNEVLCMPNGDQIIKEWCKTVFN